ncbi:MAG TPA: PIN domain-containing protein [Acidobacteriaceae bacterium]|jgi:predicted nucleic acid-binding protein|nr:PIN domain-containing protein [Acidobacteriaceae bacterium]
MSSLILFDTSVLVDQVRTGCHEERLKSLVGLVRSSSVVLAELWRGVSSRRERDFLLELERNHPILTPTEHNWLESGRLLSRIRAEKGVDAARLRTLHFDVLIALTARSYGARLITSNRADFQMIHRYRSFQLEIWPSSVR